MRDALYKVFSVQLFYFGNDSFVKTCTQRLAFLFFFELKYKCSQGKVNLVLRSSISEFVLVSSFWR